MRATRRFARAREQADANSLLPTHARNASRVRLEIVDGGCNLLGKARVSYRSDTCVEAPYTHHGEVLAADAGNALKAVSECGFGAFLRCREDLTRRFARAREAMHCLIKLYLQGALRRS